MYAATLEVTVSVLQECSYGVRSWLHSYSSCNHIRNLLISELFFLESCCFVFFLRTTYLFLPNIQSCESINYYQKERESSKVGNVIYAMIVRLVGVHSFEVCLQSGKLDGYIEIIVE